jgi:hypothetical protein
MVYKSHLGIAFTPRSGIGNTTLMILGINSLVGIHWTIRGCFPNFPWMMILGYLDMGNKKITRIMDMGIESLVEVASDWLRVIYIYIYGWWCGTCFMFPYIGNNHPNWLFFLEGLEPPTRIILPSYYSYTVWFLSLPYYHHYYHIIVRFLCEEILLPSLFARPSISNRIRGPQWGEGWRNGGVSPQRRSIDDMGKVNWTNRSGDFKIF